MNAVSSLRKLDDSALRNLGLSGKDFDVSELENISYSQGQQIAQVTGSGINFAGFGLEDILENVSFDNFQRDLNKATLPLDALQTQLGGTSAAFQLLTAQIQGLNNQISQGESQLAAKGTAGQLSGMGAVGVQMGNNNSVGFQGTNAAGNRQFYQVPLAAN